MVLKKRFFGLIEQLQEFLNLGDQLKKNAPPPVKSEKRTAGRDLVKSIKPAGSVRSEFLGLSFAGFHKVSYQDWIPENVQTASTSKPPLICVHGLTRNSHDFDKLAAQMSKKRRVICPDIVGRGQSDWFENGAQYENIQYNADMNALIARIGAGTVDWLGTSMGGLIGMMLAASNKSPIRRLILNDIGPYLSYDALKTIGDYVGRAPEFEDLAEAELYLRQIHVQFAPMRDEDWREMARKGTRKLSSGKFILNYDPKIGDPVRASLGGIDINLWPLWDMIKCPVLVIRGAQSKLLTPEITKEMQQRGPGVEVIEIEGAGHAPTLNTPKEIKLIEKWLNN